MPTYIEERTYYPTGCPPDDVNARYFQVGVFYRGAGRYVISQGGREAHQQLTSTGRWVYSPLKMTQMRWCRFDFETACRLAERAVDELRVMGKTWEQFH